jgi:tetratricopeptide (TPR) repeat protein
MLLTSRRIASTSSELSDPVSDLAQAFSGFNRQTYLRLRLALGLGLRRQVFLSICDDLALRNQLCQWLVSDLSRDPLPELQQIAGDRPASPPAAIRLVTLTLKPDQPDLQKQIVDWLTHRRGRVNLANIAFQIVGIESLTQQSAQVQRQFLNSLRSLGRYHSQLDLNLVLWVNKPWSYNIRHSAPEFWRWQTGLFQFSGEMTPGEMTLGEMTLGEIRAIETPPVVADPRNMAQTINLADLLSIWSPNLDDRELTSRLQSIVQAERAAESTVLPSQSNPSAQSQEPEKNPAIADAYRNLGNWYRDCEPSNPLLLTLGIQAYGEAFVRTAYGDVTACDLLNDLGNLYWMRSRYQDNPDELYNDLQSAIDHYQKAVLQTDEFRESARYAMLQNNLGATWGELAQQFDPESHLPASIAAYEASLRHRPLEKFPQQHASTQNNLGTAYWTLAQYQEPLANLLRAIACYDAALKYYSAADHPMPHAMIQNNLGTTYWNLSQCENLTQVTHETSQDLLIRAIGAYQIALVHRTPDATPTGYAATENNLGTAYWHLANNAYTDPTSIPDLLDLSINSYHNCLTMVERLIQSDSPQLSFDPYSTHHNLGAAYYRSVTYSQTSLNTSQQKEALKNALTHHIVAWQGWQQQPDYADAAIDGMAQVLRVTQERFGTQLQAQLLSQIPPQILSQVMPQV